MKPRSILTIGLLAILWLSACAPSASPTQPEPATAAPATVQAAQPTVPPVSTPTEILPPGTAQTEVQATEAPAEAPQAAATSRGPELESTDPSTVNLASGELQLVEFFRYT